MAVTPRLPPHSSPDAQEPDLTPRTHELSVFHIFLQKKADAALWLTFTSPTLPVASSTCGSPDSGCWRLFLGGLVEAPRTGPKGTQGRRAGLGAAAGRRGVALRTSGES